MEGPPDIMADIEAMAAQIAAYDGAQITHLVLPLPAVTALTVIAAYEPLPFRRPPSKRALRRLRGRMREALKGA